MLYSLRSNWNKWRFNWLTRGILETPAIRLVDAPWSIISIVSNIKSNSDAQMYLLSIKSFYTRIGRGKVIALINRDTSQTMRDLLQRHIVGIRFAILEDIDTGRCQRGGTWERLVFLLQHAQHEYAIQLDWDTLSFGADLDEIIECAETNRAFTLSSVGQPIRSMREWAEDAQKMQNNHIGIRAEALFDQYPDCDRLRYVRASSGFAGFAIGGFPPERIEEFHEIMRQRMGDDSWRKWGSEQCGSNFAVANSPNARVLPYPKYANFWIGTNPEGSAFLHFIGTHRYYKDVYATKARQVISELNAV
jgi:hypothetical protein